MRRAPAAFLLLVVMLAAACGSSTPSSGTGATQGTNPTDSGRPSAVAPADSPSDSLAPASDAPSDTVEPSADVTPTPDASGDAPTESASPSPSPSASVAALPCQPEGNNGSFWPGIAKSVTWDVYCAVLPKGWTVSGGSYRLANGGKLVISYKGPGGARVVLCEGSFGPDDPNCAFSGTDAGDADFGAMAGALVTTDSGGFAIVAARGETPSWLMVTSGLDQATTVTLGAALARVTG